MSNSVLITGSLFLLSIGTAEYGRVGWMITLFGKKNTRIILLSCTAIAYAIALVNYCNQ